MKEENPDGCYKPLLIAIALGTRSGKPHFSMGEDLSHSQAHMQ